MGEPVLTPALIVILFIGLTIFNTFSKTDFSESFRKNQAKDMASESNSFMRKLEKRTLEKTKYSKRHKIETECKQAGVPMKYYQYYLLTIISAIVLFLFALFVVGNEFLAIEFIFIGRMVPMQIITIMKNRRISKLEQQIGPFLDMSIKRYLSTKDFEKALRLTKDEFRGLEPIYTELKITIAELDTKTPVAEAMDNLATRCNNKYLVRFSDYYKIASSIGTQEARQNLLTQAYLQYEEDRSLKQVLKKELSEPVRDSYVMVASVPLFACFGFIAMNGYADFILNQLTGKLMLAGVVGVIMGVIWFINNKIGAPLK
jgi:tight adherence protein B